MRFKERVSSCRLSEDLRTGSGPTPIPHLLGRFGKKKQDAERKPIEEEIAELQRKFRVLENDKRAYSEDSQVARSRAALPISHRAGRRVGNRATGAHVSFPHQRK